MNLNKSIGALIRQALVDAQNAGMIPDLDLDVEIPIERPLQPEHGDLATSLPLKLARTARTNPMLIAERVVSYFPMSEVVDRPWVAHPGFVNFRLKNSWLTQQLKVILQEGKAYGTSNVGLGKRVQVEYVSVNPTGPLHVGHARGAIIGSALANIMSAAGYNVTREYYVNDAGSQMDVFYRSLYARYLLALNEDAELPENGYKGAYLEDMAKEIVEEQGRAFLEISETEAIGALGKVGLDKMLRTIREDLESAGVTFDVWFREQSLYDNGQYQTVMDLLKKQGYLVNREGAVWFSSTSLGDEKDNVLVRSTLVPTYFASDVAYHYNKFLERGFDRVVNVWGADHQGHVPRMKSVVTALGVDSSRLTILIAQMVSLKKGDEALKMSKRSGDLITLRDLMEEVGTDACRYFFLARSPESQMEFDLDLAKQESADNPVYYIQYAHARIAGILRNAQDQGIDYEDGDLSLLTDQAELALIRKMVQFPELIDMISETLEPHHLPHYSVELATAFHWFYQQCRVLSEDLTLTKVRLMLTIATQHVLAHCLDLMGMTAPEHM